MKTLCAKAMEILMEESNVQRVDAPVTVSGAGRRAGRRPTRDERGAKAQVARRRLCDFATCVAEWSTQRAVRVVDRHAGARRSAG